MIENYLFDIRPGKNPEEKIVFISEKPEMPINDILASIHKGCLNEGEKYHQIYVRYNGQTFIAKYKFDDKLYLMDVPADFFNTHVISSIVCISDAIGSTYIIYIEDILEESE